MLAGCPEDGIVLDPFSGAATTGIVAVQNGRKYIGIELNPEYIELSNKRYSDTTTQMGVNLLEFGFLHYQQRSQRSIEPLFGLGDSGSGIGLAFRGTLPLQAIGATSIW